MDKGQRIRLLRTKADMTQQELGEKIGVSKQNLHKYETGLITNIPSDKIEAISEVFDVSPAYLMGWEDKQDDIQTIAAHHEGDEWTDEELDEIEAFKQFVKSKRKQ